jgi:hypothetical protein
MTHSEPTDKDALVEDDQSTTKPHGDVLMPEAAKQDGLGNTPKASGGAAEAQSGGQSNQGPGGSAPSSKDQKSANKRA